MRYPSIDLMRTVAICLMVIVHFVENLSGQKSYPWLPTGFAAPIFTFLSGISYSLWLNSQRSHGATEELISKRTVRRGLFLLGVGFAFNILVWMPDDTYNWDVLTFVGSAWLFLGFVRDLPAIVSVSICVMVFVFSPVMRVVADYPAYWTTGYFDCDMELSQVSLGFLVTGYFPFFPWIILPLAGYLIGQRMLVDGTDPPPSFHWLALAGASLMGVAWLSVRFRDQTPAVVQKHLLKGWTMFPPSPEYLLTTMGFVLLVFSLLHQWIDRNPRFQVHRAFAVTAASFSQHAFTMYLLHHVVHLWPLWIYGVIAGHDATHYWQTGTSLGTALTLAILFLVVAALFLRWMDRTNTPGMESLMRWLCD